MLVFEAKLEGTKEQYERLYEAIRTALFMRNSCLRYWMNNSDAAWSAFRQWVEYSARYLV
ncbi:MAG TPA: hypothetical protein VIQ31_14495 [Phormidium sp.]